MLVEDVERETQAERPRELGCQVPQGSLYARPMPATALEHVPASRRPPIAA